MAQNGPKKYYRFKIVLLGDSGVGKTSIASCLSGHSFSERTTPTIAAAFTTSSIKIDAETTFFLEVWDTAGQERFRSLTPLYYRGARAAFVIYSITEPSTFEGAKRWIDELRREASSDLVIVLLGNKCDLRSYDNVGSCVPAELAMDYADAQGIAFLEVSAKVNLNIENSLRALCTGHAEGSLRPNNNNNSDDDNDNDNAAAGRRLYRSLAVHVCGGLNSPLQRHSAAATVVVEHRLAKVTARIEYFNNSDMPCEGAFVHRLDAAAVVTDLTVNINDRVHRAAVFESSQLRSLADAATAADADAAPILLVTVDDDDVNTSDSDVNNEANKNSTSLLRCSLGLFPARQKAIVSYSYVVYLPAEQLGQQSVLSFRLHDPVFDETSKITCLLRSPAAIDSIECTMPVAPLTRAQRNSITSIAHFSSPSLANLLAATSSSSSSSSSSSPSSSSSSVHSALLAHSSGSSPLLATSPGADASLHQYDTSDDTSVDDSPTWLMIQTRPADSDAAETALHRPLFQLWAYYHDESACFRLAEQDRQLDTCIVFESTYVALPPAPALPLPSFIFLVDMNSSMLPSVWRQVRRAVQTAVHSLQPGCRFNVVGYGSCVQRVFDDGGDGVAVEWNEASVQHATETLQKWNPDLGDPDLLPVVESLFAALPAAAFVFLVSDGQPSNVAEILQVIESHAHAVRVFATGASPAASVGLLESIARAGRGSAALAFDQDSLTSAVLGQLRRCLYPPPHDSELPPVHAHVLRRIPRLRTHACGASTFAFSFVEPAALPALRVAAKFSPTAQSDADCWFHKFSVYHMFADLLGKSPATSAVVRAVRLSKQYGVVCPAYTCFGLVETADDTPAAARRYTVHRLGSRSATPQQQQQQQQQRAVLLPKKVERKGLVDFLDELQPLSAPGQRATARLVDVLNPLVDDASSSSSSLSLSSSSSSPLSLSSGGASGSASSSCCGAGDVPQRPAPAQRSGRADAAATVDLPEWANPVASSSDDERDGGALGSDFDLQRSHIDEQDRLTMTARSSLRSAEPGSGRSSEPNVAVSDVAIARAPQAPRLVADMAAYPYLLSQLACYQLAQGSWPVSNAVLDVLRLDLMQLEQMLYIAGAASSLVNDVWVTALAVAHLQLMAPAAYHQWQLIAHKAVAWLATCESAQHLPPSVWLQMARKAILKYILHVDLFVVDPARL